MDAPVEIVEARALQVPTALRAEVKAKVADAIRLARQIYRRHFDMPRISYGVRGAVAGKASLSEWEVKLNATLLKENAQEMVSDTVVHEVAHLVTRAMHGRAVASHGDEWKSVMRSLGVNPSRTHSFDVTNAAVGRLVFKWGCGCREAVFSDRKHHKLVGGQRYVTCRKCKNRLRYTGERRVDGVWQQAAGLQARREGERPGAAGVSSGVQGRAEQTPSEGAGLTPPFGGALPPWFGPPSWEKAAGRQTVPPLATNGPVGFTDVPPFGGGLPPWYRRRG
jgi:SprT protein